MKALAVAKIASRSCLKFTAPGFGERHLLGYPVTNHPVPGWERLAGQLRLKVAPDAGGTARGLAFHVPCGLPESLAKRLSHSLPKAWETSVWDRVHQALDAVMERMQ